MSGRSRHRKSHHPLLGRFGSRRTLRVERKVRCGPDWRLSFDLPRDIAFCTSDGRYGNMIGLTVENGRVLITGKNRTWVLEQAVKFLTEVARDLMPVTVAARLTKLDGAQLIGPPHRKERDYVEVVVGSGPAQLQSNQFLRLIGKAK